MTGPAVSGTLASCGVRICGVAREAEGDGTMKRRFALGAGLLAVLTAVSSPGLGQAVKGSAVGPVRAPGTEAAVAGDAAGGPPGLVDRLRDKGANVTGLGALGGLSGWLVEPRRGDAYTLYVTGAGHAVAGLMYGPDGALLTGSQLKALGRERSRVPAGALRWDAERDRQGRAGDVRRGREVERRIAHVPGQAPAHGDGYSVVRPAAAVPPTPVAEGLFARSADLFGFTIGHWGPAAVLFADPGCRWSRDAVAKLRVAALKGRFRLRVIPVGLLGEESARAAVRIVSSADPMRAWFGSDVAAEHRAGGMWIEESNGVFEEWGENAVPLLAWRDREKGPVYRVGTVRDAEEWVLEAFGR